MNTKAFTISLIVAICSLLLFSNCASIVTKTHYPVQINSNPGGANVSIVDKKGIEVFNGVTPTSVKLKSSNGFFSKAEYQVKFSIPGYQERIVQISSGIDGWYFGNIFFGGVLGMLIIDPATGAMWKIDTEYMNETLAPLQSNVHEMRILDVNDVPDNMKEYLVKIN